MKETLLGPKEVAARLGVPVGYIYKLTSKKPPGIPFFKIGKYIKFSPSDIEVWLFEKGKGSNNPSEAMFPHKDHG